MLSRPNVKVSTEMKSGLLGCSGAASKASGEARKARPKMLMDWPDSSFFARQRSSPLSVDQEVPS